MSRYVITDRSLILSNIENYVMMYHEALGGSKSGLGGKSGRRDPVLDYDVLERVTRGLKRKYPAGYDPL